MPAFKIMAHRGASAEALENTAEAFRLAITQNADLIETDVRLTGDGVLVLAHDAELAGAQVERTDLAALRARHPALLTVSAALAQFGDEIPFCWEIKTPGIEAALVTLVHDLTPGHIWEHTQFTSFSLESAAACQRLVPGNVVGWLTEDWSEDAINRASAAGLTQICPPAAGLLANPDLLATARAAGLGVRVWQIESPEEVPSLASMGIDGGTVNWPGRAWAALAATTDAARDEVLYQDDLIRVFAPCDAHIAPRDGGHLIVEPQVPHTGIETCERDLRHRLIDGVAAASAALLSLPHMQGGIVNVQDNGNWFYRNGAGQRAPKRLHFHVYGRAPQAVEQPFGEALRFPSYAERHTAIRPPLAQAERKRLRAEITARMTAMLR